MATYYLILTAYGAQRIAQLQADQSSAPLLVNFVAGDANGQPYLPRTRIAATALLNQRISVPLQSVDVVDADRCQAVAVLDATVGGFNIHEIGISDDTGQLVYIGNYHGAYKPMLSEGAGGDLTLVLDLVANGIGTVIISPDPSFVYAGQDWVDANFVRIPTFNAHVAQNAIEHANLLALIAQLNAALAIANENIMDNQTIQNIQATLTLMQERLVALEENAKEDIDVGSLWITTNTYADAAAVAEYKGYGTWQRFAEGQTIVGLSTENIDPTWTKTIGQSHGNYNHQLSAEQLPSHNHGLNIFTNGAAGGSIDVGNPDPWYFEDKNELDGTAANSGHTRSTGEGQAFDIVQPSVVVGIWLRMS